MLGRISYWRNFVARRAVGLLSVVWGWLFALAERFGRRKEPREEPDVDFDFGFDLPKYWPDLSHFPSSLPSTVLPSTAGLATKPRSIKKRTARERSAEAISLDEALEPLVRRLKEFEQEIDFAKFLDAMAIPVDLPIIPLLPLPSCGPPVEFPSADDLLSEGPTTGDAAPICRRGPGSWCLAAVLIAIVVLLLIAAALARMHRSAADSSVSRRRDSHYSFAEDRRQFRAAPSLSALAADFAATASAPAKLAAPFCPSIYLLKPDRTCVSVSDLHEMLYDKTPRQKPSWHVVCFSSRQRDGRPKTAVGRDRAK